MQVIYGANGTFTSPKTFTGSVACSNSTFGDPLYGVVKHCETAPVPPPTTSTTTTTAQPQPPSPPTNTQAPTLGGSAHVGQTLTVSQGTWTGNPTTFAFQWSRCDRNGSSCSAVGGANSATYNLTQADFNSTMVATVTASNAGGSASASSAASGVVKH
jgi:hypothetical protein